MLKTPPPVNNADLSLKNIPICIAICSLKVCRISSDLYSSKNSKRIISDFEILKSRSRKFTKEFKGELISLSQEEFYKSIKNYEFIQDIYGKLSSYCDLLSAENFLNKENSTFVQSMREKLNIISSSLIFYELEITTLPTKKVKELFNLVI